MTKTEEYLASLTDEQKAKISEIFGSMEKFYQCLYLIAKNEHIVQMDKPEHMEQRLKTIHDIQDKIEKFLDSLNLSGYDIFADIKSDYLEDYLAMRSISLLFDNEEFVEMIRKVSTL
ncbi:MAG: hypothetical protein ACRCX4_07140 [Bacteroidales bacterium]